MTDSDLLRTVAELKDRSEINQCLMTYSRAVDRLDRDLLLSVYHPDAVDDHGVFVGSPAEFADWVIDMHTRTHLSHQHCQFNCTIDLDGDTAHAETYYMFIGMNRQGDPLTMTGGRYLDRLERREGRWAIAERICLRDWAQLKEIPTEMDQSKMTAVKNLPEHIVALMRSGPQTSRDRSDPSYARPLRVDRTRTLSGNS